MGRIDREAARQGARGVVTNITAEIRREGVVKITPASAGPLAPSISPSTAATMNRPIAPLLDRLTRLGLPREAGQKIRPLAMMPGAELRLKA